MLMAGNVNGIVESFYAADNVKSQQSTARGQNGNFSDYLNLALSNYRTGLLTGGLGSGLYNNSLYFNTLTGSAWQDVVLKALKDELKKNTKSDDAESTAEDGENESVFSAKTAKKDWAKIRVIERYKSPMKENESGGKEIRI